MRLIFKNVPADLVSKSRVHKLLGEYWFYKVVPVKVIRMSLMCLLSGIKKSLSICERQLEYLRMR